MAKKRQKGHGAPTLFELPPLGPAEVPLRQLSYPIWTENKARLIANYIRLFELITKHGTYIDGFAGPQRPDNPEMWSAKLVLELEPPWLRHFYLFDKKREKAKRLEELRTSRRHAGDDRDIVVCRGDFNVMCKDLLCEEKISQREAVFCLLDQQTFECHWATVERLARYKQNGSYKIELFYFLAAGWFRRAVTGVRKAEVLRAWWGRDDWSKLISMYPHPLAEKVANRFQSELGYALATPWPIYERQGTDNVMYYMIHASDHKAAPELMSRAYDEAVHPGKVAEQSSFTFENSSD